MGSSVWKIVSRTMGGQHPFPRLTSTQSGPEGATGTGPGRLGPWGSEEETWTVLAGFVGLSFLSSSFLLSLKHFLC